MLVSWSADDIPGLFSRESIFKKLLSVLLHIITKKSEINMKGSTFLKCHKVELYQYKAFSHKIDLRQIIQSERG